MNHHQWSYLLLIRYDETLAKLGSEEHEGLFSRVPDTKKKGFKSAKWKDELHLRLMLLLEATLRRLFPETLLSRPPSTTSPDTLLCLTPLCILIPETRRSFTEAASKVPPDILRSRVTSLSS